MADIVMPQLGESVTEGTITRWFKGIGDTVTEDEPLFEVSTDKVDTEVPAPAGGVLSEIRVQEGETVDVGTVLAVLGDGSAAVAGDTAVPAATVTPEAPTPPAPAPASAPAPAPAPATVPAAPAPAPPAPVPAAPPGPVATAPVPAAPSGPVVPTPQPAPPTPGAVPSDGAAAGGNGVVLSPLVRRLITDNGLDPSTIAGTGIGGRITRDDVLAVIDERAVAPSTTAPPSAAPPSTTPSPAPAGMQPSHVVSPRAPQVAPPSTPHVAPAPPNGTPMRPGSGDTVEPLNNIRRLTGEHMVMSKAVSPHAITMVEVDYEAIERVRRAERDAFRDEEGFGLTFLPFISRAVVDALHGFPHMNASVADGTLVVHNEVHLAVAVDLDYQGLLAPVITNAHERRLRAIAREIHDLATRARSKQLGPDELTDGTFTISNSGSYGTAMVVPIINQPQVAILSTDGIRRKPVVVTDDVGNESIGIHPVGNLTLSWDHRAFDGAYAAAFMARLKEILETRDWAAELG